MDRKYVFFMIMFNILLVLVVLGVVSYVFVTIDNSRCDQMVKFSQNCENFELCTGIQYDEVTNTCGSMTNACCTVTSAFDSVDECKSACIKIK